MDFLQTIFKTNSKNLQKYTQIKLVLSMGVADKNEAKIYRNSRKLNQSKVRQKSTEIHAN